MNSPAKDSEMPGRLSKAPGLMTVFSSGDSTGFL
jgi:hypothetical protein